MAESTNVITRAVAAGHRPRSFLMAERWLAGIAPVIATACGAEDGGPDVPVYIAEEPVLREITGFHLHRGALAAMHRPELPSGADVLAGARGGAGARRGAGREDIGDHTTAGAICRPA